MLEATQEIRYWCGYHKIAELVEPCICGATELDIHVAVGGGQPTKTQAFCRHCDRSAPTTIGSCCACPDVKSWNKYMTQQKRETFSQFVAEQQFTFKGLTKGTTS